MPPPSQFEAASMEATSLYALETLVEDSPDQRSGRIITFYSYKGGTGRSMTLANVAWILASSGRRVLIIDWDLEAPGLHRYFAPFLSDPELTESPGLIDFFWHFVEAASLAPSQPSERPWYEGRADLSRYALTLEHENLVFPKEGQIDFVGAGLQGASYGGRVNSFQWGEFYEKLGGGLFLEVVKQQLRAQYDYILIDSRTGLSDTSGICTVQMPDELVVCFTLNRQSIHGAAATAHSADLQRRREDGSQGLRIWPVTTRVELNEKDRLEGARRTVREKFAPFLWHIPIQSRAAYWGGMEMLYFPYYAYEEVLATLADRPGTTASLLNAMEVLTGHLTSGVVSRLEHHDASDTAKLLACYRSPTAEQPPEAHPQDGRRVYISYANADNITGLIKSIAEALTRQLGPGAVFWDEHVPLGADWFGTLESELKKADLVMIVAGQHWLRSKGSSREFVEASRMKKRIVPVLAPGGEWDYLPEDMTRVRGMRINDEKNTGEIEMLARKIAESLRGLPPELPVVIPVNPDDPQKGQWGGKQSRGGWALSATVVPAAHEGWFRVGLIAQTFEGIASPSTEAVFHLYPGCQPPVVHRPVLDGRVELSIVAWGAFTVGVELSPGGIQLELDLAEVADAPKEFRER